jgi:hypothetical protein
MTGPADGDGPSDRASMAHTLRAIRDEASNLIERPLSSQHRQESEARINDLAGALRSTESNLPEENRLWYQRLLSEIAVLKHLLGHVPVEDEVSPHRTETDISWHAQVVRDFSKLLLSLAGSKTSDEK